MAIMNIVMGDLEVGGLEHLFKLHGITTPGTAEIHF
jgi:hypothetical protein